MQTIRHQITIELIKFYIKNWLCTNNTTYIINNLTIGNEYKFKVSGVNIRGEGYKSEEYSKIIGIPSVPLISSISRDGYSVNGYNVNIFVSYFIPNDAISIVRSDNLKITKLSLYTYDINDNFVSKNNSSLTNKILRILPYNTTYIWRVSIENSIGESYLSPPITYIVPIQSDDYSNDSTSFMNDNYESSPLTKKNPIK